MKQNNCKQTSKCAKTVQFVLPSQVVVMGLITITLFFVSCNADSDWENALSKNSYVAFYEYIQNNPDSEHLTEARKKMNLCKSAYLKEIDKCFVSIPKDKRYKVRQYEYQCEGEIPEEHSGGIVKYYVKDNKVEMIVWEWGINMHWEETSYLFRNNNMIYANTISGGLYEPLSQMKAYLADTAVVACLTRRYKEAASYDSMVDKRLIEREEFREEAKCDLGKELKNANMLLQLFKKKDFETQFCK